MASQSKLRVIKIIDPIMCVKCDHAYIADVVLGNGERKKYFYCSRLDCDNWFDPNKHSGETIKEIEIMDISRHIREQLEDSDQSN